MFRNLSITIGISLGLFLKTGAQDFFLSGKITDANGVGIFNVDVDLYDINGNPFPLFTDKTDAQGNYTLNQPFGLPAGTYDVAFKPPAGSSLAPVINPGYVLAGNQFLNDTLPFGFVLSGTVRDTGGVPLPNIDLNVSDELSGLDVYTPNPTDNTDANGFYSLVLPANGVYTLTYRPVNGEKLAVAEFTGVVFNSNLTKNVALQPGYFVSGEVLDNSSQPVQNASIKFKDSVTKAKIPLLNHFTDNNGRYQVVAAAGLYDITAEPVVADKLVAGQKLSVHVGNDTANVNFTLPAGLYLSGFVRRTSDMAGVGNVDLDVHDTTAANTKLITPFDFTDATGFYRIVVPTGTFNIVFQPLTSTGLASVESLRVLVAADRALNANLPAGFTLSGTVQRSGGGGLGNVDIKFLNSATGAKVPLADHFTNAVGSYKTVAVAGNYTIKFEPPKATRRTAKQFLNFPLNANMSLNVTLDSGRSVSGFIRDSLNNPIFEVDFDAFLPPSGAEVFTPSDNTDSTGHYEAIVPPGTPDLAYTPPLASRFAGVSFAGALIANDTTINLTLRHGVQLSGIVRDSAGNPLSGVRVRAFASPEAPLAKGTTDLAGNFAGIFVPGVYSLHFTPPAGIYDSLTLNGVQVRIDSSVAVVLPRKPFSGVRGDLSNDGQLSAADIVYLIGAVFSQAEPPAGFGACDMNCTGTLSGADIVTLVSVIFNQGTFPC